MALLLSATPALAQAPQTIGIQPVDTPANKANDPRARFYIVDHVAPGTTLRRQVEVSNDTSASQNVALYAASADVGAGAFTFGDAGTANDLTRWTTVTPASLRVGAGGKEQATVTITVPHDATSGERYAVVWAAVGAASSPSGGILQVNRVGVRIYLSVGSGPEPPTDFAITSLTGHRTGAGAPTVRAFVRNTGGRAVDLSGSISLRHGPGGRTAGPFPAQLGPTLGIGEGEPVLVSLSRSLPRGAWDVSMVLRSGSTQRRATARVALGVAAQKSRRLPFVLGAVGVVVLLAILVILRRRRARTVPSHLAGTLLTGGSDAQGTDTSSRRTGQ